MPRAVKEWIGKTPDTKAPPRVRLRILERENHTCYLSGRKILPGEPWQADHKIAIINGGENRETNLFPALVDKHAEKTKRDVAEKAHRDALAKSHAGIKSASTRKLSGPGFPVTERALARQARGERLRAEGPTNLSRRFV